MADNQLHIAVVGAGIAGLTVAAALRRQGIEARVFDQAPRFGEVGAGVQIAPNAARVLHRLGLAKHLRAVAVRPAALEMRRFDDGRVLRRTELGDLCTELYGVPYYTVHRADLHQGLAGLLPRRTVHLGQRCVGARRHPDGVELDFADGTRVRADVVIGADGIHSAVRETLVADRPVFSGHSVFRGLVPAAVLRRPLREPTVCLWLGPGRHFVRYPVASGTLVSLAATAPAPDWTGESWTARGSVAEVLARYEGWHEDVVALLRAVPSVGQWALHDREPVTTCHDGRVVVIGDAAHPMLPFFAQGANQAIEDAAVLAGCLAETSDPATALARYAALRGDRTRRVQEVSRRNTHMLHLPDGPEQRERDRFLAATADIRGQDWLYGYDAQAAVALPA